MSQLHALKIVVESKSFENNIYNDANVQHKIVRNEVNTLLLAQLLS